MKRIFGRILAAVAIALASPAFAAQGSPAPAAVSYAPRSVLQQAEVVADWRLAHLTDFRNIARISSTRNPRNWEQAAFYVGLAHLAERSRSPKYKQAILAHGRESGWRLGDRVYHADDHAIAASYIWAERHGAGPESLSHLITVFDRIVDNPSKVSLDLRQGNACFDRWCWCDALFMAPPPLFELSYRTKNPKYADFAHAEFKATTDYLFDPQENLYYRDSTFFGRTDPNGKKLFWARGNGWVFAGLARILEQMPKNDPRRPYYEDIFRKMAGKLKSVQKADGYWPPSLLGDHNVAPPETSGTGFFTYGLAYGIKSGLLKRAEYEPSVRRGWAALVRAVQPDGMLGYVQQVSDRPEQVAATDTQFYGTGAFLLAASAVADLKLK